MEELPDTVDVTDCVSPAAEIGENKSLKSPLNAKHKTTNVIMEEPSRSASSIAGSKPTESTSKSTANTATSAMLIHPTQGQPRCHLLKPRRKSIINPDSELKKKKGNNTLNLTLLEQMEEGLLAVDVTDAVSSAAENEEDNRLKSPLNVKEHDNSTRTPATTATSGPTPSTGSTKASF